MKIKPQELLRWVLAPAIAACLLGWLAAPAYPKDAKSKVPELKQAADKQAADKQANSKADTSTDAQEIRKLMDELQAREREDYTLVLEGQRKTIDWWFSFLAIVTAVMAIVGALIPFLMARKDKELIEQDKTQIKQMLDDAKATVAQIHKHEDDAKQLAEKMKTYQSGKPDGEAEGIREAVSTVENDPESSDALKLRAKAIAASEAEEAEKSYYLWSALTDFDATDASAHFNAGYWAQQLGKKTQGGESLRWLQQAGQHYSQTLAIKPNMHEAAYNWGIALNAEAEAIAASDLDAARKLWQQAGEKYQQALSIKPDKHEAVYNWGVALVAEAQAIAASSPDVARKLWRQAGEQFQQALSLKPDKHEAANNWGVSLNAEAEAIAASDLDAARKLWQQAGKKYQQALSIKPDKHGAATNWGAALVQEANALAATDTGQSRSLLDRAEKLLLEHAEAAPGVVAYNLACVYGVRGNVANCLKWLKISHAHNTLPDCDKLKSDPSLNAVRTAPEFIEWFKTVCPQETK